ncbi:MAG: O-antigen ligase [Tissierellia bacterium]|nr:O-antigen ligase [Tissierellia bacterium]
MRYILKFGLLLYLLLTLYTIYIITFEWNKINLLLVFIIFSSLNYYTIWKNKSELFSPQFFLSLLFYISYILPVYFLSIGYKGNNLYGEFDMFNNHDLISQALWISFFGYMGVLISLRFFKNYQYSILKKISKSIYVHKFNYFQLFLCLLWFVFSAFIRIRFNLGAAGRVPNIQFAGVLQYIFYDGNLILFSYLLLGALKHPNIKKLLLVILLGFILVFTQILLGWRGSIFNLILIIFSIIWLFANINKLKLRIPKPLIVIIVFLIPITMQMGNNVRNQSVNEVENEITSVLDFFEYTSMRKQGLTRLIYVVANNKKDYTLFNDFFFIDLYKMDRSVVNYIDENYHGISRYISHSVGGSGVGTTYLLCGIFGVFISFFLLSTFLILIYNSIKRSTNNDLQIIIYSSVLTIIMYAVSENFDISVLKRIFVVLLLSIFWGIILFRRKRVY